MAFLGVRQDPIGIDIGQCSIVGVQLSGKGQSLTLVAVHERPLPDGLVVEGEVIDVDGLAAELKAFLKEGHFRGKLGRFGVANQKVIVRTLEVPDMDERELRGAIEFQAQDYIPMPVEDVILDFQVVRRMTDSDGVSRQQIVLVAAQREMVQSFLWAGRKAGLTVDGIDVSAFAVVRALTPPPSLLDEGATAEVASAFLHLTSSNCIVVVSAAGIPLFTRTIGFSYQNFIRAIQDKQGLGFEEANVLAELVGLAGPLEPVTEDYEARVIEDVRSSLGIVAEQFLDEVRRSLDYYHSQEYSLPVASLVLSGRGPLLRNLDHVLEEGIGLPVQVGDPLFRITTNKSRVPDEVLVGMAPRLAVAVGLVLDEVD